MRLLYLGGTNIGGKVRRDAVLVCLRQGHWRLALTVLFMPNGYELSKSELKRSRSDS